MGNFCFLVALLMFSSLTIVCCRGNWDIFVFTQQWPRADCIYVGKNHNCSVAPDVKGWTIHGLWPTLSGTRWIPNFCNKSWPFNLTEIKSLKKDLEMHWPNLYLDTPESQFWEEEWLKHGTCATSLPATKNEYLYFKKTLDLNRKFDIQRALEKFNITPSWTTLYQVGDIKQALNTSFPQSQQFVSCFEKQIQKESHRILREIEMCLGMDFKPVPCKTCPPRDICADDKRVLLVPMSTP